MRKRVAVVGATGIAGQQFLVALAGHPWFEVARLAASERSAGKTYARRCAIPERGAALVVPRGAARRAARPAGRVRGRPQPRRHRHRVHRGRIGRRARPRAAVRQDDARPQHRLRLPLRAGRADPGAGGESGARRADRAPAPARGWAGFIAPLPNCTTMGLVVTLRPLLDALRHRAGAHDLDAGPLGGGPLARG